MYRLAPTLWSTDTVREYIFFFKLIIRTIQLTLFSQKKNAAGGTNVRRIKFDKPITGDMQESFVIDESGNIKKGDKVQKHVVKAHTPQGVCVLKVTNHSSNTAEILIVYPHGKSKGKVNGRSRMSMRCPPGAVAFQYVGCSSAKREKLSFILHLPHSTHSCHLRNSDLTHPTPYHSLTSQYTHS